MPQLRVGQSSTLVFVGAEGETLRAWSKMALNQTLDDCLDDPNYSSAYRSEREALCSWGADEREQRKDQFLATNMSKPVQVEKLSPKEASQVSQFSVVYPLRLNGFAGHFAD